MSLPRNGDILKAAESFLLNRLLHLTKKYVLKAVEY